MPITKFETLSIAPNFGLNKSLEDFFDDYYVVNDIECYQLFFCPWGEGTSFADLNNIKFKSPVVILNIMDSIIDKQEQIAIKELKEFCSRRPEQNFIIFCHFLQLDSIVSCNNLYTSTILSHNFNQQYEHCTKENIKNQWLILNSSQKVHREIVTSYLLSKKYYKNGYVSYEDADQSCVNLDSLPLDMRSDYLKGYRRLKTKQYRKLNIPQFNGEILSNYHLNLLPIYKKIAVEIVTGTMFFQPLPIFGEKEIQSIYGKNFPIFINSAGAVNELKTFYDLDLFDDIINHKYDSIKDPFARIKIAVDSNKALLNGSINLKELWLDNQLRFAENCRKFDEILYNHDYQRNHNRKKIMQALNHFNISYTRKDNDNRKFKTS